MRAQHHAQPDPQHEQTEVLGAAPPDGVVPLVVVVRLDLGGLGRQVPRRRLRLDVGQRLLLSRARCMSTRRGHSTWFGSWYGMTVVAAEIARVADRRQVVSGSTKRAAAGRPGAGSGTSPGRCQGASFG